MLFFPTKEQGLEEVCFNADVSTNMLLPGRGKKETSRGSLVVCEEKEKKKKGNRPWELSRIGKKKKKNKKKRHFFFKKRCFNGRHFSKALGD